MVMEHMSTMDWEVLVAIGLMAVLAGGLIVLINHICVMRQLKQEHLYEMKEDSLNNANAVGMMEYQIKLQREKDMAVNNHLLRKAEGMCNRMVAELPKQMMQVFQQMDEES